MQAVSIKFFKKGKLKDFGVGGGCDIKVIVVCILGNKFQEGAKLNLARRVNGFPSMKPCNCQMLPLDKIAKLNFNYNR